MQIKDKNRFAKAVHVGILCPRCKMAMVGDTCPCNTKEFYRIFKMALEELSNSNISLKKGR